jgi:FtsP/CotA-like multicopper oxidase with cupredoxin domain
VRRIDADRSGSACAVGSLIIGLASMIQWNLAHAEVLGPVRCPRPAAAGVVEQPTEVRSQDGVLSVDLELRNEAGSDGAIRYCYVMGNGAVSPTLRLKPGDLLLLRLKNAMIDLGDGSSPMAMAHSRHRAHGSADPCTSGAMTSMSTNLHFHGMGLPPVCHADEVLQTSIQPTDPVFEYRFRIPEDEPPGLYWYHPHVHGFTAPQVQGGASGALIVEGIEQRYPAVAGLPERVIIIRDLALANPNLAPTGDASGVRALVDPEGDAINTGSGSGKPSKDLSINFVPVAYPEYPPAIIRMKAGTRELWRVLNASSVTYLNLVAIFRPGRAWVPQSVTVVAIDGVPLDTTRDPLHPVKRTSNLFLAPGARAEFIVNAPRADIPGVLATRAVDTGTVGENDPNRVLATIITTPDAPSLPSTLPATPLAVAEPHSARALAWIGDVAPKRVRKLYFSEDPQDATKPNSSARFYLTVEGQSPAAFDPRSARPNIVVKQGDVEDWIIENRSSELHAFHIHQLHFRVLESDGLPVNELFLRDTVNVPFYRDGMKEYPKVRIRMDFRDPTIVGTFPYHCHLLDHEDAGMMGLIRVDPPGFTLRKLLR